MGKKAGRAANGMGSIRQRANGSWEGRYTDPNGQQRSVYGKTQKEVTRKLKDVQHEVDSGSWINPSKMTVGEWLDVWLDDYQADTTERTVKKNRGMFYRHFIPIVGGVKIVNIKDIHVQRIIRSLKDKKLADSTIQNYMGIFAAAMNQAKKSKLIADNPATDLSLSGARKKDFHIVDKHRLPAFFEAAKATLYPNELSFGILTGLRVGEIGGLRWCDIDMDNAIINVRQQLRPKNHDMARFTLPKYKKTRSFHVPPEAIAVLKQQRKRQAEQRIAAGNKWIEDELSTGLVFRKANGAIHGGHTIERAVKKAGEIIGIPELHPHDLRHSYAVAALRAGADVKTVQHNLGHATVRMTLDVYAAYTEDAGKQSAAKLSDYLSGISI